MNYCSCCGLQIPDNQKVCSMCYGDIAYGNDGYYEEWARQQENEEIIKAVTSNGMREWTDERVNQALDEARKDEAVAFSLYKDEHWIYLGINKYRIKHIPVCDFREEKVQMYWTIEEIYEKFKKEQDGKLD